jgi:4,5-dihydroxyphthalate decarboxylase
MPSHGLVSRRFVVPRPSDDVNLTDVAHAEIVVRGMEYEHTLGVPGSYDGITLRHEFARVHDTFTGMTQGRRFEVCEFSLANYLTLRAAGNGWLTAIPVFPYRAFRHSLAFTRKDSPLVGLRELAGRRVGVEDYSMTAAVWFRALLREEYGVDHRSITWVTRPGQRFPLPRGATVEQTDSDLEALAAEGAIDALLVVSPRDARRARHERQLRPVLSDAQSEERAYYERTRTYPIHHCIVIRCDVLERIPTLPNILYGAYERAKTRAYERRLGATLVPWGGGHWLRTFDLFGGDPLPYGWTPANRAIVERLAHALQEQGFVAAVPDVNRLFTLP